MTRIAQSLYLSRTMLDLLRLVVFLRAIYESRKLKIERYISIIYVYLLKWVNTFWFLELLHYVSIVKKFVLMQCRSLKYESRDSWWKFSFMYADLLHIYKSFKLIIDCMKMRWIMLIIIHIDFYSQKT